MSTKAKLITFLLISPILLAQGIWVFKDAKKRGEKYYWLWGIYGLLNTPGNLIVYLIVTRLIIDKHRKKNNNS
ncbi:hypothetical protein [Clostridium sp. JNZ J1-5]